MAQVICPCIADRDEAFYPSGGNGVTMKAGYTGNDWGAAALLKFDFSGIPSSALINSITLYVRVTSVYSDWLPCRYYVADLSGSVWSETDDYAKQQDGFSYVSGGIAVWQKTENMWNNNSGNLWASWNVTEIVNQLRTYSNNGICIIQETTNGNHNGAPAYQDRGLYFASREYNAAYSTTGYSPYILVDYTPDTSMPTAGNAYSETPVSRTTSTFRVWATGVSDPSGVSSVRFPTQVQNQVGFIWFDGVHNGGGNWYCDIPVANAFGNREGIYETHVYLYDGKGNSGMYRAVLTTVDRTGPAAPTISVSPGGWSASVTVTITAGGDNYSGVNRTEYSLDGGGWTTYNGPLTLTTNGSHSIQARSIDNAGNVSAVPSATAYVDKTAPNTPSITLNPVGWTSGNVTVTITGGTDGQSGTARTEYNLNGGAWTTYTGAITISATGTHSIQARTIDNAANVSALASATAFVDKVLPTGSIQINGGASRLALGTANVTLTLAAADANSGVKEMFVSDSATFANGAWEPFATSKSWALPAGPGAKTVYVAYKDTVGNQSVTYSATIQRNTPPTASITNLASGSTVYNSRPMVTQTGADTNADPITQYEVMFASDAGFTVNVVSGTTTQPTFTPAADIGIGSKWARVRAHDGYDWGNWSASIAFTVGSAGGINDADTGVKRSWVTDLRTANNQIRAARGMAAFTFTDPVLTADVTQVRAIHLTELRTAFAQIADALGVAYKFTDETITPDVTQRVGKHWSELQALAKKL